MKTGVFCVWLMCILIPLSVTGQRESHKVLTLNGGTVTHLSNNANSSPTTIMDVTLDSSGVLWAIGVEEGIVFNNARSILKLYRYNGYEFDGFALPGELGERQSFTMTVNPITSSKLLICDRIQWMYALFDISTFTFSNILDQDGVPIKYINHQKLGQDIFFCTNAVTHNNILKWDGTEMQKICELPHDPEIVGMHVMDNGILYCSATNGLRRYGFDGSLQKEYTRADFKGLSEEVPMISFINIVTSDALNLMSIRSESPTYWTFDANGEIIDALPFQPAESPGSSSRVDLKGNFMLLKGFPTRFLSINMYGHDGVVTPYSQLIEIEPTLRCIASRDFSQKVWFGSNNGLYVFVRGEPIHHQLAGRSMRNMLRLGDGRLIAATEVSGWFEISIGNENISARPLPGPMKPSICRILQQDNEGWVWSSADSTLTKWNPLTDDSKSYRLKYPAVEAICRLTDGRFLLGNGKGKLSLFEIAGNGTSSRQTDIQITGATGNEWIHAIVQLDDDNALVCAAGWIAVISLQDLTGTIIPGSKGKQYLSGNLYDHHVVYTGTYEGALNKYTWSNGSLTLENSIPIGASVASITPDDRDRLWLGTFHGITVYNLETDEIEHINVARLVNAESNRYSAYFDTLTRHMLIGTVSGLNLIDLNVFDVETPLPTISLSSISIFAPDSNRVVRQVVTGRVPQVITIPPANKHFAASFYLNNMEGDANTFAYRLGNDQTWISLGAQHEVTLPFPEPGNYSLQVVGYDSKGKQTSNDLNFNIQVLGFFYEQSWFYYSIALLLGVIVFLGYRRNVHARKRLERIVAKRTEELRKDKETIERQAEELTALDKLKTRFYANISHELRTPLTLILGPLKKGMQNENLDVEARRIFEMAARNADQLKSHIDELLDLTKLEAAKLELDTKPIHLLPFFKRLSGYFDSFALEAGIQYEKEFIISPGLHGLLDEKKISKVVSNLLANAFKYTPSGGCVQLYAGVNSNGAAGHPTLHIEVKDDGIGISEEDQKHVFDRYYQTQNVASKPMGGTGIGLALVREYIALMHGQSGVNSVLNHGSTFYINIPLDVCTPVVQDEDAIASYYDDRAATSTLAETDVISNGDTGPHRAEHILVTEDHPELRDYLKTILQSRYHVTLAKNGREAWDILQKKDHTIGLVLSDVMMPEMDGFELLTIVRKEPALRYLPFIFLTARVASEDRLDALRIGVDDYILKPFDEEELLTRIANLLASRQARLEWSEEAPPEDIPQKPDVLDDQIIRIRELTAEFMSDPTFSIDLIADRMEMNRRTLHRLIKNETGLTPNLFVREVRLLTARTMLENGTISSVQELSRAVGFQKTRYFSDLFKQRFGKSPSVYLVGQG